MIPTKENETNIYHHFYQLNSSFGEMRENSNMPALSNQLFSPQSLIEINNNNNNNNDNNKYEEGSHQFMNGLPSYSFESKDTTNITENMMIGNFYDFNSNQEHLETSPISFTAPVSSIN